MPSTMDQYALDYGLVCPEKISLSAHKMHGFPSKMNTFNLGACSTVAHKRASQLTSGERPYHLLLSGNRQGAVDYFGTKRRVCSWRVRSRQASMFFRVPGPWSSISHCSTALQLRDRLCRGTAVVKSREPCSQQMP